MTDLDRKVSDLTLGELLEILNYKPSEIEGNKGLADYLGYTNRNIQKLKQFGTLDGTFRQTGRKIFYNRKKIDKLFNIK
jgi:hypothetical protein